MLYLVSHRQPRVFATLAKGPEGSQEQRAHVDALWEQAQRRATARGQVLFDGPLFRLVGVERRGRQRHLRVAETSYRHFVAGCTHPNFRYQRHTAPVGAQCYLFTSDWHLILLRRSQRLAVAPGALRGFGGTSDPRQDYKEGHAGRDGHDSKDCQVDLALTAFRETCEELLDDPARLGLCQDRLVHAGTLVNPHQRMCTALHWCRIGWNAAKAKRLALDQEHDGLRLVAFGQIRHFAKKVLPKDPALAYYLEQLRTSVLYHHGRYRSPFCLKRG